MDPQAKPIEQAEPGEPVTIGDVAPFARGQCNTCFGRGYFRAAPKTFRVDKNTGDRKPMPQVGPVTLIDKPCGCALRAFIDANQKSIVHRIQDNALCWEVGKSPKETAAATAPPPVTP